MNLNHHWSLILLAIEVDPRAKRKCLFFRQFYIMCSICCMYKMYDVTFLLGSVLSKQNIYIYSFICVVFQLSLNLNCFSYKITVCFEKMETLDKSAEFQNVEFTQDFSSSNSQFWLI
jgi:hypothetical protein